MSSLHWPPASAGRIRGSCPLPYGVGIGENFHILGAKWCILRLFSGFFYCISFTIEGIKVLGEQILEKS